MTKLANVKFKISKRELEFYTLENSPTIKTKNKTLSRGGAYK